MPRLLRSPCAPLALLIVCAALPLGCGTREDRAITFSAGGGQVGFQHGREGVFVADKDGGSLTKIFTPGKDVIAVGTPLWAPNDRRLIFTTARAPDGDGSSPVVGGTEEDPAGRLFNRQPAVYTCWLRDEPRGDARPEPRELFTVPVDDVGYMAAGLAVRWHPKGDRVLYVKQADGGPAVFEFDLATKASRRVFPDAGGAGGVVFDWAPDGSHLVCLLADTPGQQRDGIWVGRDGADWWHVAESAPLAIPVSLPLERLKASRPAWTGDGQRFAFVTALLGPSQDDPVRYSLWTAAIEGHGVKPLLREQKQPPRDLAWHPDGRRLGFVSGEDTGSLRVSNLEDVPVTVAAARVRSFAGWDRRGERLAYTTVDDISPKDEGGFALLLFPDPLARDTLRLAPGDGKGEARPLVSGLRTTFVRWSPEEDRLSQWFTFCPTHRSVFSLGLDWGLPRGDPAAVVDAGSGKVSWLTVDADEKAQVGHHLLLRRAYAGAWQWYEQAERERDAGGVEPGQPAPGQRRPFRDPSFFSHYCLDKLGRHEEAAARLDAFRKKAPELLPVEDSRTPAQVRADVRRLIPLARDLYAAEVFLSLDAAEDGEAYLRRALAEAQSDEDRLSAAVALSQVLLLRGRGDEYAALATETLAPLVLRSWQPRAAGADLPRRWAAQPLPVAVGSLALLPLGRPDLLAKLPPARLTDLADRWAALRKQAPDDLSRLGADVILEGLYRQLRRDDEAAEVRRRIGASPLAAGSLLTGEDITKSYRELREALEASGLALLFNLRRGP
jgi:hypothetical protein